MKLCGVVAISRFQEQLAKEEKKPIKIYMPDGAAKEGTSWVTTPMMIAEGISKGLAKKSAVANVIYLEPIKSLGALAQARRDVRFHMYFG